MLANSASVLAPVTMGVQGAVPLVFSILAALAAARNWRADLVEERRRLRVFIVVTGIVYTLASLAARLASPRGQLSGLTATLDVAGLLVIVLAVAVRMLRMTSSSIFPSPLPGTGLGDRPNELATPGATSALNLSFTDEVQPPAAPVAPAPPDPAEERLAQALHHAMLVERAYREEEMSLNSLAARLDVPEYRLRRLINQRLGYRNFNAYINGFRLDAVRAALVDPARRDLPVLTLALVACFQSIGPFNRAFKAATGLTPTEFRKDAWGRPGGETSADS
jgi:AraC-like DNA-binding protein